MLCFFISWWKKEISNNKFMKKGDILFGRKNSDAIHPIVYLRYHDRNFFIGAMLTKSKHYEYNIPMKEDHFKNNDSDGRKFEFDFNNTRLVNTELIKKEEWQPFRKVGELTDEGIKFVESKISDKSPVLWEEYINNKKQANETK